MAEVMPATNWRKLLVEDDMWAQHSTRCLRRGTAAHIVSNTHMRSYRELNTPTLGCTNKTGDCGCVHAEQRAIVGAMQLWKGRCPYFERESHLVMLTTLSPCTGCANLIVTCSFISEVYYLRRLEHDLRGLQILSAAGVQHQQL